MPRTHYLSDRDVHYLWDAGNAPLITIDSGDTVVVHTRDISDNQVFPGADASVLASFDWDRTYPLTGPIAVHGAQPGDTLRIDIVDMHTQGWGWTGILPGGFGLLPEDFPDPYLKVFDLTDGDHTMFREDITIPLAPYYGTTGVCPAGASARSVLPPGRFGGNMDIRQTVRGSTLYLPVEVPGANFSCGDAHAAQGDGEVCVTAIESPMYGALRFTVERRSIPAPQFRTAPGPLTARVDGGAFFGTTGVDGDIFRAAQDAVRAMIDHLGKAYALSPEDAYLLCSLVVDLKISEIVDGGQFIVAAVLPEAIFAPGAGSSASASGDGAVVRVPAAA
jgi:acetamidase/formamidase